MAGISILIVFFILMIVGASSLTGIVLFILSIILRKKEKDSQHNEKGGTGKRKAGIILAISLFLQIPLIVIISGVVISSAVRKAREIKSFEAIENKVIVREDEWRKGFDYNGKTLVPVNFLMNSGKRHLGGVFDIAEYIGALAIENTYDHYSFYQLNNESGYELFYVHVSSFAGGEYYSRTFVDENDYDAVMEYYCTADLSASALWESAPENSKFKYSWEGLDLDINDKRNELMNLFHEVLDDISDKKRVNTSIQGDGYDCFSYNIKSNDGVFSTDLRVYAREDELLLLVNEYKVESEIVEKYKGILFSLVSETTAEMEAKEGKTDEGDLQDDTELYLYLADLDIPPVYAAFLRNEISVPNPFVAGDELSFFDDREYAQEEHVFECASKIFSLVDVNDDGASELIFTIYDSPDELTYILGIQGDQLVCYDVFETHTTHMSFRICENGIVIWGQNYDGAESVYYTYDEEGSPYELIHFVCEEADSDSGLYYDYYYMDGDETAKCSLQSNEEYEALVSPYEGGQPEWFFCDAFADIPKE